jgi:hypothetical protein
MNRLYLPGVLGLGLLAAGCNNPTCGPGTKQHQDTNGDIKCVPADSQLVDDCDVDAGATVVGTKCVSAISCGPNTKLVNGQCIGTGGNTMPGVPDPCPAPGSMNICVNGTVRHFLDNSLLTSTDNVRVWVVDPLKFLAAPDALTKTPCPGPQNPCLAAPANLNGADAAQSTFLFPDLATPAAMLIAVAVTDGAGVTPQVFQTTGTGAKVVAGMSYQVDAYATPHTLVTGWKMQAGVDYELLGAYVAKFYLDAAPSPNKLTAIETMPASGVTMIQDTLTAARAKYFEPDLMNVSTGLPMTGMVGAAILPGTGDSQILAFSGSGNTPGTKWETHPGNTTQNVVFVDRFHPCTQDGNGKCTN